MWVESFPATGFKRQVSTQGGFEPHWRRDGTELFCLASNQTLMAVGVKSNQTTLVDTPPKALFATRIKWMEIQAAAHYYAAAPDGQRFLISSATDEAPSVPVTIVLNWFAALKKSDAIDVSLASRAEFSSRSIRRRRQGSVKSLVDEEPGDEIDGARNES